MPKRRRAEIACILCKNNIIFPEYVGANYNGDLLCATCESLMRIRLDKGVVREFRVLENRLEQWKKDEKLRNLQETMAEAKHGGKQGA